MLNKKNIPLHIHISYLFTGLMVTFAVIIGLILFDRMNRTTLAEVDTRYTIIGKGAASSVSSVYLPAKTYVEIFAHQRLIRAKTLNERLDSMGYITTAIDSINSSVATYIGYGNGELFFVRKWREGPTLRKLLNPPENTAWVVQSQTLVKKEMRGEYLYFDRNLKLLERRFDATYRYDPRTRPWYLLAQQSGSTAVATDPYYFYSSEKVGVTYAKKAVGNDAVVAMDIEMDDIQKALQQKITPRSRLVLINSAEEILCWQRGENDSYVPELQLGADGKLHLPKLTQKEAPILRVLFDQRPKDATQTDSFTFKAEGELWQGAIATIAVHGGQPLMLLIASPHQELLEQVIAARNNAIMIFAGLLLMGILAALRFSLMASKPLNVLTKEAEKIQHFEFDEEINITSHITEVNELAQAMGGMKSTIQSFLELSTSLASENNFDRLLDRVLEELSEIAGAAGGAIYLLNAKTGVLEPAHASIPLSTLKAAPLQNEAHPIARAHQQGTVVQTLTPDVLKYIFDTDELPLTATTLIAVPLKDRKQTEVGVITLLLQTDKIDAGRQALVEALSGTAAVAIENQRLIQEQKTLLEAFIQLIAGAIDAKSPYTGGHCQRVPELTKMLAHAACSEQEGTFADFQLDEAEWEELHIAAWLHDCGKVTTPEYVVDKATKLETLYDRIHEIRMRFEVLKRDAHLTYWQALQQGGDEKTLAEQRDAELAQIDDDFAFVAQCNEGGEFMAPEKIERIKQIASKTWLRTLSDRVGIAHEEKERKQHSAEASLPTIEPLLADKAEHLFVRSQRDQMPDNNPWGFKVKVPEYLYNRGELYNLCVGRGTLSEEERYKINEHIIQTIIMLEKLPFPRHLSRVPEIAGGHHEKMDGTGYPKRLKRDEMSLPARMMAIADIFEALTAVDRPYKKGKTLSESIKIMGFMRKDQHIDPDLFALFLRSGIYLEYAKRYMKPEQIDEVDISSYLS
jgi:HD-GYP domain-containing protein (c-di-GMP phosphodiesterase class II)/HAMP domain-containing protein